MDKPTDNTDISSLEAVLNIMISSRELMPTEKMKQSAENCVDLIHSLYANNMVKLCLATADEPSMEGANGRDAMLSMATIISKEW